MANTIFSDSWFRVSGLRVALLPSVEVKAQTFRGQKWHVLQDTYTQRYFRATEQACKFILSLRTTRTVEEIWEEFVNTHPADAPSQEEVIQILSQLHLSNLLYSLQHSDDEAIVDRYKKQKNKELRGKLASFLFLRVPLWNPDPLLNRIQPLIRFFTGWTAFCIWLVVVVFGVFTAIEYREALVDQSQGVLSVGNLPWLYVCLSTLKLFHEAGHAFVCKRFGGEVRTFGVMFLMLTPLPYVDATSSWGFPNRWHRIYVSFAGMAVEFFFAAAAALIWVSTGPGLTNSLAFNVMLIGSVSSVLFNGNPLLRFDAYYMLSDYAEIPNFYQKAQQQWKYFGDRYILGSTNAESKATDTREWYWLTIYGLLSFIYLMIVTLGISLFLLDQWLPLGILVVAMTVFSKVLSPGYYLFKHITGSKTQANRRRAIGATIAVGALLIALLGFMPFPYSLKTSGILQANASNFIYLQAPGKLEKLHVRHGDKVRKGQLIATLVNPDLLAEISIAEHAKEEALVQYRQALHNSNNQIGASQTQLDMLESRLKDLNGQLGRLNVISEQDGEWIAPELHETLGSWLQRGNAIGELVDRRSFRFLAIIQQEQAEYIFKNDFHETELRLAGQADVNIVLPNVKVIPYQNQRLPSVALGWLGGGEIPVSTNESSGDKARDSFFILHAEIPGDQLERITVLHGLSGTMRIKLSPQPLLVQAYRSVKQLVQKRYSL